MIDREKIIDELKEGIDFAFHRCHCGLGVTLEMALALLEAPKEQEPIAPITEQDMNEYTSDIEQKYFCGACRYKVYKSEKYCANCGRKIKWNA